MASTPVRSRGRKTTTTPRRRGPGAEGRKPAARARGTSKADDLAPLLEEGLNLAEQALGKGRFAGLWGFAPALVGVAGRYARREPKKAAGLVLGLGALLLVGRALMGSPGPSSGTKSTSKSKSKRAATPARKSKSKPKPKPAAS